MNPIFKISLAVGRYQLVFGIFSMPSIIPGSAPKRSRSSRTKVRKPSAAPGSTSTATIAEATALQVGGALSYEEMSERELLEAAGQASLSLPERDPPPSDLGRGVAP